MFWYWEPIFILCNVWQHVTDKFELILMREGCSRPKARMINRNRAGTIQNISWCWNNYVQLLLEKRSGGKVCAVTRLTDAQSRLVDYSLFCSVGIKVFLCLIWWTELLRQSQEHCEPAATTWSSETIMNTNTYNLTDIDSPVLTCSWNKATFFQMISCMVPKTAFGCFNRWLLFMEPLLL